jgi:hypothetical protein
MRKNIGKIAVCAGLAGALAVAPLAGCSGGQQETTYDAEGRRFTVPSAYFGGKSAKDCESLLENIGATDIVANEDGSYTVTMSNSVYESFVKDTKASAERLIDAIPGSKSYPYVTRVAYNDDLTEIKLTTVKNEVVSEDAEAASVAMYAACLYQSIAGMDLDCTVTLVNTSNAVVASYSYPFEQSGQ